MLRLFLFFITIIALALVFSLKGPDGYSQKYYIDQTNFKKNSMPVLNYQWGEAINGCLYKNQTIPNSYFASAKLALQNWKQALSEFSNTDNKWNMSLRLVNSLLELQECQVRFYILDSYRDMPEYPLQTSAYSKIEFENGMAKFADIYLPIKLLHAEDKSEINLPLYAFSNIAKHEIGHLLGLGHTNDEEGYLMSPKYDYIETKEKLPITSFELVSLVEKYGLDGFVNK